MRKGALALAVVPLLLACGDDPAAPAAALVGSYQATELVVSTNGEEQDLLAIGSELTLTLENDFTAHGHVFVADGDGGGKDLDMPFAGTWSFEDDTVRLDHPQDTFLRDIAYERQGDRLVGEAVFGESLLRVEFSRLEPLE